MVFLKHRSDQVTVLLNKLQCLTITSKNKCKLLELKVLYNLDPSHLSHLLIHYFLLHTLPTIQPYSLFTVLPTRLFIFHLHAFALAGPYAWMLSLLMGTSRDPWFPSGLSSSIAFYTQPFPQLLLYPPQTTFILYVCYIFCPCLPS